jgi:hypothetical protein
MNLSDERRGRAIAWLRAKIIPVMPNLGDRAVLCASASLLICDETGHFTAKQLTEALDDPSVVQAANKLLADAMAEEV